MDGDVRERQGAHDQLVLLDRVHAAELRAERVADRLVARAGAHDVGDPVGHLPVARPQDGVVRAGRSEEPLHLDAGDHVLEAAVAVLRLRVGGEERVAGGDDHRADADFDSPARADRGRSRPPGRPRCTRGTRSRRRSRGSGRRSRGSPPRSGRARAPRSRSDAGRAARAGASGSRRLWLRCRRSTSSCSTAESRSSNGTALRLSPRRWRSSMNAARRPAPTASTIFVGPATTSPAAKSHGCSALCSVDRVDLRRRARARIPMATIATSHASSSVSALVVLRVEAPVRVEDRRAALQLDARSRRPRRRIL